MDARSPNPIALNRLMTKVHQLRLNKAGGVDALNRRYHDPEQLEWLRLRLDERQWNVIMLRYGLMGGRGQSYQQIGRVLSISPGMVQKVHDRALLSLSWLVNSHEAWLRWQDQDSTARMTASVELLLEVDREHSIAPEGSMKSVVASLRRSGVDDIDQLMRLGLHGLSRLRGFKGQTALGYVQRALEILELIPKSG